MKKTLLPFILILSACMFISSRKIHSGGEVGATGAPGENTCGACHGGGAAGTSISITAVPDFTNNEYVPQQSYSITITVSHPSQPAFGFNCAVLTSSNSNAGTISNAGSGVQIANFGAKTNVTHTAKKFGSGSASFTFNWTAPASGNAIFYVGANAVNNSNNTAGDSPATTSLTLTAASLAGIGEQDEKNLSAVSLYPNPSSDISSVSYFLKTVTGVRIEIIQLDGKLLKTVSDETEKQGRHQHIIDLKDIPKGVYFLKLSSGSETLAQKMLLIR